MMLAACLFSCQISSAQTIANTKSYYKSKLSVTSDTINGTVYSRVKYLDSPTTGELGRPELPVRYIHFSVPYNATDFSVTTANRVFQTQVIDSPVFPVQLPITADATYSEEFLSPDTSVYGKNEYYPNKMAEIVNEGFLEGDNKIVTVAVYPVSYNPSIKTLRIPATITVRLSYTTSSGVGLANVPISRPVLALRDAGIQTTKEIVVNSNQVEQFAAPIMNNKSVTQTVVGLPAYEYCVITSRELAPAFDKLIGWKRQKGYSAGVVCIEDILSCPDFQNGDEVSGINDDAGKLRAYLRYSFSGDGSGKYVLLAGDYSVLPIRYAGYSNIPTDSYFCDLNGNWNTDNDGIYGEYNGDDVDFFPELYVGRLLCTTPQEIENYTIKLLQYELNPGDGDFFYLKKSFMTQCDQMLDGHQANNIAEIISTPFSNINIFSEILSSNSSTIFPTGSECIEEMNNHYGLLVWHGHGNPGGIGVSNNSELTHGIVALQNEPSFHTEEAGNGLDNLTNFKYPTIAISPSCSLTPFDVYTDMNNHTYDVKYNVGSSFTVGGLYGGPAFVGNTRPATILYGHELECAFIKRLVNNSPNLGQSMPFAKADLYCNYRFSDCLMFSLIGCPEFEMWTDIPDIYNGITVTRLNNTIALSGNGLEESKVAVTSSYNGAPEIALIEGPNFTFENADPNSPVLIYKHNSIPYIAPLLLQNGKYQGKQYIFANEITMGKNVDGNRTSGTFYFMDKSNTTFNAKKNVEIHAGTEFSSGSVTTIKSDSKVLIYGGLIAGGATVNISAPSVEVVNEFEVRHGGILNINQK